MRKYVVFICVFVSMFLYSQEVAENEQQRIDSLKRILNHTQNKENTDNYVQVIAFYARKNRDSSKKYVHRYLDITKGSPFYFDAVSRNIFILQLEKKYEEAISILKKTIQKDSILLHQPENKYLLLKLYTTWAEIYTDQRELEKALEIYYKSVAIYESQPIEDEITYFINIFSISELLSRLSYFERSMEYSEKLETLLETKLASVDKNYANYKGLIMLRLHNYMNRATIHHALKDHPKAIAYMKKTEQLSVAEKQLYMLPKIYAMLSNYYATTNSYEDALSNGLKAIEYEKKYRYPEYRGTFYYLVGNSYVKLSKPEKAITYLDKSLAETSVETSKIPILTALAKAHRALGNSEKAIDILIERSSLQDSLYTINLRKEVAEITERYENEKKQKQITLLNSEKAIQQFKIEQQSFIIYGILGFLVLLCILGVIWYQNYRQKQQLKEAILNLDKEKLQQRFLRMQLNPHFFFHALASIESYIYKEDKETAADFLQKFSSLMRAILESSDIDFISLQSDIDFIQKYLALQSVNNNHRFTYAVTVAPDLKPATIMIPPMLIQPFVENAIIHGVSNQEKGHIDIAYCIQESQLMITITDNGKGVQNSSKKSRMLHRSMSTDIIKQRIDTIQKAHDFLISYEVVSTEKTIVIFFIPVKYGNFSFAVA